MAWAISPARIFSESTDFASEVQIVGKGEVDVFALRTITEIGVIDLTFRTFSFGPRAVLCLWSLREVTASRPRRGGTRDPAMSFPEIL